MDQAVSLDEIKEINGGLLISSQSLEVLTEKFLEIERRLEESCALELDLYNLLVVSSAELKSQVIFFIIVFAVSFNFLATIVDDPECF